VGEPGLDAIFEPFVQQFQTAELSSGGLGLGLAIVRALVRSAVRATSAGENHGSEFIVELPAVPAGLHACDGLSMVKPRGRASKQLVLSAGTERRLIILARRLRGAPRGS
jgi:hypothetical protein